MNFARVRETLNYKWNPFRVNIKRHRIKYKVKGDGSFRQNLSWWRYLYEGTPCLKDKKNLRHKKFITKNLKV